MPYETFAERLGYSGLMLLVGMGAVFGVLALLWGALALFRRLVVKDASPTPASAPAPAPAAAPVPVMPAPAVDNGALIAVITAAVAAAISEETGDPNPSFRVVAFRQI